MLFIREKKPRKIILLITLLIFCCTACGYSTQATTQGTTDCKVSLKGYTKFFKLEMIEKGGASCSKVKIKHNKVGTYFSGFAFTNIKTDLFLNYRIDNARDKKEDKLTYGSHTMDIEYYLYDDVLVDGDAKTLKDISGIAAIYYLKINDMYLSGIVHTHDLDEFYDSFKNVKSSDFTEIIEDITINLDTYTNLKEF